jgi:hypothetical protein
MSNIRIQSSADVRSNGIKGLVYGKAGVGKTPLCATAPAPIIISAESGLLSIQRCNPPIPFIEVKTMPQLIDAYNWCAQSHESRQFYTICLDSISEVMEVLLETEKTRNKDPRKAYGELLDQGLKIARAFRDLPGRAVLITAKEEFYKDDATGMMQYGPMLPGSKLGPQLPYFFDEVFQMFVGNNQGQMYRALRCNPSGQHIARDRSGVLAEFEAANITTIFQKILAA